MADPDTYTVHDRGDVKDRLDELGVNSVRQIRRAHGSYRHGLAQAGDAERLDLHATGSPDELAANLAALHQARCGLEEQARAVERLLAEAESLDTPMRDGHGPIARAMKKAFRECAGDVQGTKRALREYRAELGNVLTAIQLTLERYEQSESSSARRLTASGEHDG